MQNNRLLCDIYRRYAGRTEHEMHRQEPALHQSCADRIARLVNLALAELSPIVRRQPWYRDLHAKAKLLKPVCSPGKEKAPVSGAATPEG